MKINIPDTTWREVEIPQGKVNRIAYEAVQSLIHPYCGFAYKRDVLHLTRFEIDRGIGRVVIDKPASDFDKAVCTVMDALKAKL